MLELARMGEVRIVQDALFGDIWVFDPTAAADDPDTGLEELAENSLTPMAGTVTVRGEETD